MTHTQHRLKIVAAALWVFGVSAALACGPKHGETQGETTDGSTVTSMTGETETTIGGTDTHGTSTGSGSETGTGEATGMTGSGGSGGAVCEGPEHEDFQKALCPYDPPDCTPAQPPEYWENHCSDMGIGPVGEGECGCVPRAVWCGDQLLHCCCLPGDIGLDP